MFYKVPEGIILPFLLGLTLTTNQGLCHVLKYLAVLIMEAKDPFKTSSKKELQIFFIESVKFKKKSKNL